MLARDPLDETRMRVACDLQRAVVRRIHATRYGGSGVDTRELLAQRRLHFRVRIRIRLGAIVHENTPAIGQTLILLPHQRKLPSSLFVPMQTQYVTKRVVRVLEKTCQTTP